MKGSVKKTRYDEGANGRKDEGNIVGKGPKHQTSTPKSVEKGSHKVSKRVTLFRGWRLFGVTWGTCGASNIFVDPKMSPHRPKSASKD